MLFAKQNMCNVLHVLRLLMSWYKNTKPVLFLLSHCSGLSHNRLKTHQNSSLAYLFTHIDQIDKFFRSFKKI